MTIQTAWTNRCQNRQLPDCVSEQIGDKRHDKHNKTREEREDTRDTGEMRQSHKQQHEQYAYPQDVESHAALCSVCCVISWLHVCMVTV